MPVVILRFDLPTENLVAKLFFLEFSDLGSIDSANEKGHKENCKAKTRNVDYLIVSAPPNEPPMGRVFVPGQSGGQVGPGPATGSVALERPLRCNGALF